MEVSKSIFPNMPLDNVEGENRVSCTQPQQKTQNPKNQFIMKILDVFQNVARIRGSFLTAREMDSVAHVTRTSLTQNFWDKCCAASEFQRIIGVLSLSDGAKPKLFKFVHSLNRQTLLQLNDKIKYVIGRLETIFLNALGDRLLISFLCAAGSSSPAALKSLEIQSVRHQLLNLAAGNGIREVVDVLLEASLKKRLDEKTRGVVHGENFTSDDLNMPLHNAILHRHQDIVRALLHHGEGDQEAAKANPKIKIYEVAGWKYAAFRLEAPKIAELLLDAGALSGANGAIDTTDEPVQALAHAAEKGDLIVVQALCRAGVGKEKYFGKTALMLVVQNNNARAVKILLDSGLNPTEYNCEGRTALELAILNKNQCADISEKIAIVKLLFEAGIQAGELFHSQQLFLDAVRSDNLEIVKLIHEILRRAKVNLNYNEVFKYDKLYGVDEEIMNFVRVAARKKAGK